MNALYEDELQKALVGVGINAFSTRVIGLRGDQSLRHTVYTRERIANFSDLHMEELANIFLYLLTDTGIHRLSIGFNNDEIKTFSIFDPFNMEVHKAEDLVRKSYYQSHFPQIHYAEKAAFIDRAYEHLLQDNELQRLPYWQAKIRERNQRLNLPSRDDLRCIFKRLPSLRSMDNFFLRSMIISLFNSTVSLSFNCDGTQLMAIAGFDEFLKNNF
ncbi:hypothetical protein QUF61_01280 [Candidatus Venteria ishoeyi]|uniref:hypothetical protein n=1 Tax=Candidatus Venteria ishoeyi TaxID=1899563 RepID=UPI0025A5FE87|nr:hypothetical protein [Candidatus Venteria ishoeyi]MDM8545105.1 hypothetical protein [Candidatus Venteria ishoeyi]